MAASTEAFQRLTALFDEQPCWMIQPLAERLNCAIGSVRRFLAKAGYYSSFTHNGRWYTLAAIPRFSRDGLWFYQGIGFSRDGSLTRTLEALIAASPAGMTAEALGEKLHCHCHSVLVVLWGRIQRQRRGRAYVYLAAGCPCGRGSAPDNGAPGTGSAAGRNRSPGAGRVHPPSAGRT